MRGGGGVMSGENYKDFIIAIIYQRGDNAQDVAGAVILKLS